MLFTAPVEKGTVVGVHRVYSDGSWKVIHSRFIPRYKFWYRVLALFNRRKAECLADLFYAKRLDYEISYHAALAQHLNELEGRLLSADRATRVIFIAPGSSGVAIVYAEQDTPQGLHPIFEDTATVFNAVQVVQQMDALCKADQILVDTSVYTALYGRLKRSLPYPERVKRHTWAEGGSL